MKNRKGNSQQVDFMFESNSKTTLRFKTAVSKRMIIALNNIKYQSIKPLYLYKVIFIKA